MDQALLLVGHWMQRAVVLLVLLASLGALAAAAPFEVEPTFRATVATTTPLPERTILKFSVRDFKKNEVFMLQRCGDPCNTAKMIRTWRKSDFDDTSQKSVVLTEAGTYYFWIMKTLANGEVGPVLGEASTFEGMKGSIRFASGTSVLVEVELPGSQ